MTRGFPTAEEFQNAVGWELYQITIDKFHVMFWFENGHALLNIADSFSFRSADNKIAYTYKTAYVDGTSDGRTFLNVNGILRKKIVSVEVASRDNLELCFENGDVLTVHDNPKTRSWWFYRYAPDERPPHNQPLQWHISDIEPDEDI